MSWSSDCPVNEACRLVCEQGQFHKCVPYGIHSESLRIHIIFIDQSGPRVIEFAMQ